TRLAAYEGAPIEQLSTFYTETLFQMLRGGLSAVHPGNEDEEHFVHFVTIQGGNARLPEKMADALGARLHLNMPLTKIVKAKEGFTLFFDHQVVYADILVLAIPCSVYDQILFEKDIIEPDRLQAIQRVQYGTNAKILVPVSATIPERRGVVDGQGI